MSRRLTPLNTACPTVRYLAVVALAASLSMLSAGVALADPPTETVAKQTAPADTGLELVAEPIVSALPRLAAAPGGTALPRHIAPRVAWNRVTVFAPASVSASRLQDDMARLFHFTWYAQTDKDKQALLMLDSPVETRRLERQLYDTALDRAIQPVLEIARYTHKAPGYWAKYKTDLGTKVSDDRLLRSRNLFALSTPYAHAALSLFDTMTRAQLRMLADTGSLALPWASMTPQQQSLALASCARATRYRFDDAGLFGVSEEKASAANRTDQRWVRELGVTLFATKDTTTGAVTSIRVSSADLAGWDVNFDNDGFVPSTLPVRGSPYRSLVAANPTATVPTPPASAEADLERVPFPSAVTALVRARKPWPIILQQLSRTTDKPVLSDAFSSARHLQEGRVRRSPSDPAETGPDLTGLSLPEGLDKLCADQGYLWWYEKGTLFFRSRTWFIEQQYEVPPPIHERLAAQTNQGSELTPAALDTLAGLTLHQMEGLVAASAVQANTRLIAEYVDNSGINAPFDVASSGAHAPYLAAALALWTQLSPDQKQAALSAKGMPASSLNPAQARSYLALVTSRVGRTALADLDKLRLRIQGFEIKKRPDVLTAPPEPDAPPPPAFAILLIDLYLSGNDVSLFPLTVPVPSPNK